MIYRIKNKKQINAFYLQNFYFKIFSSIIYFKLKLNLSYTYDLILYNYIACKTLAKKKKKRENITWAKPFHKQKTGISSLKHRLGETAD